MLHMPTLNGVCTYSNINPQQSSFTISYQLLATKVYIALMNITRHLEANLAIIDIPNLGLV
jgi:hypothetical protein